MSKKKKKHHSKKKQNNKAMQKKQEQLESLVIIDLDDEANESFLEDDKDANQKVAEAVKSEETTEKVVSNAEEVAPKAEETAEESAKEAVPEAEEITEGAAEEVVAEAEEELLPFKTAALGATPLDFPPRKNLGVLTDFRFS